jgi:hypothetical protein
MDTVKRRRVNDGFHARNGCTDIIDLANIPDNRFHRSLAKVTEIEEANRVTGCHECGDDSSAEVASSASDQDLHMQFIPGMSLRFLRRVAFRTDGCFVQ